VRDALRAGDLYLPGSRHHVSFWNLVYDEQRWAAERNSAYDALVLPTGAETILGKLRQEYTAAVGRAAHGLDGNPFASVCDGRLQLKCADVLEIPERTRQLRHAIETGLPRVRIEELLQEVDRECGFTRELRPIGGYEPRLSNLYQSQLAALIAHGTNLGIAAVGHSAEGITADMLPHVSRFFLTDATLKTVNAVVVNFHHRLGFSGLWGAGSASSSDGQRFGIQSSSLLASFYPRYFGYYERAITLYTHTSDQYSVFGTRAISCSAREALYVLDGLLENDTILRPHEHSTDTHGFTEQLFGLCYLLGYSFMPRLRDLADQQLYRVDPESPPESLRPLLRAGLDLSLLGEQWDRLVRVAASLRNRVASAHVVLQRLANASPANRVAKALTNLGRVVKTIYILRYIHEEDLRRRVQLQLNRGESRHALARWLFFANRGEFRSGDYEEIMNKASCLSLLSNAVLVWNTMAITKIITQLRGAGETIVDEDLARISPLMYQHVIPNGTYQIARSTPRDDIA
jgi:TnpA family transposase